MTLYNGNQTSVYWKNNRLCAICIEGTSIYSVLGKIKKKNDGRYEWSYIPCKHGFFPSSPAVPSILQGVSDTKEDAEIKLETLWGLH